MTNAAPDATPGTFRLIYRSRNLIPEPARKAELGELFTVARSNNKKQHITGALLLSGDWFVQTLEGDETAVRTLFDHIQHDPRHESVAVIDTRTVPGPLFSRWAMARVAEEGESDIPLIAHTDGISPAAGHPTTAEQEQVLDIMRAAARGGAVTV